MTPAEVADKILDSVGKPDYRAQLAELRPFLSIEVITLLKQRSDEQRLRNARLAVHIATAAGDAAAVLGVPEAQAIADFARGNALFHHTEFAAALSAFQRSEATYRQLDRPFEVVKLQNNQVAALRGTGDHRAAIVLAEQARAAGEAAGEPGQRILALLDMNLGAIHIQIGELELALKVLDRGRAGFVALGDEVETARIDINRANVLQELGRFAEAEAVLGASRAVLGDGGYEQEAARADYNLGTLAYRRGQYQAALRHFERARTRFAAVENDGDVATVDLFRSLVYRELNLLRETVSLAASAEHVLKREAASWLCAQAQINQGVAYRRLGARLAAERQLLRARRNLARQGAAMRVLTLDLERAHLALEAGRPARARRITTRVARELDVQAWPELQVQIELLLADCDLALLPPNNASARTRAERALALAVRHDLPSRMAALWMLGRSLAAQGELYDAWQALSASMDAVERARALLPVDEFSTGFMEDKLPIYADAVRVSRRLGDHARLLYTLDRSVAAPLPPLRESPASDGDTEADPAAVARLRELRESWHWLQSRAETSDIMQGRDSQPENELRRKVYSLEDEIAELARRLQVRIREPEQERTNGGAASNEATFLAALQARLLPHEALIQYFEDDGDVGALLITRSLVQLQPALIPVTALQRLLGSWRLTIESQQLAIPESGAVRTFPHLRRMYELLVRPLAEHLARIDRLFLVLPAGFHDLPFAAFADGSTFLVEKFVITHLSAAGALLAAGPLAGPRRPRDSALIVGYSDGGRLPNTLTEANAVQAALEPSMQTTCLLEDTATGYRIRATIQQHQLLHLATHAIFRADNPMFSWIRLADTRFTVADMYELTLPQRPLVVLSACETGRGTPRGGGLLGMGRGFLAAGASGLIVSRWPVADSDAATLMVDFYHELLAGQGSNAEALAYAQRTAIRGTAQPNAWAAFLYLAA